MAKWPSRTRECLYYLAVGHYRLGQYSEARSHINELLKSEPSNQQAHSLQKLIEGKASRGFIISPPLKYLEGIIGMALVGGLAAAAAGLLIAAVRSRTRE
jgi:fission 1 protein